MGKLSFFRQNAVMISRRKQQTADRLNELKNDLSNAQEELKVLSKQLRCHIEITDVQVTKADSCK